MWEAGGLNWDEQAKKTFLNTAIATDLQKALITTPIPATYVDSCDLLPALTNNYLGRNPLRGSRVEIGAGAGVKTGFDDTVNVDEADEALSVDKA